MSLNQTNHTETRREDWETPDDLFESLDGIFNFSMDLCASNHNSKATKFIDEEIDIFSVQAERGVAFDTDSNSYLWINPPYKPNGGTKDFVRRALELAEARGLVCLIPAGVGNKWWKEIVWTGFDSIIFPRRISFKGAGNAMFDCAICIKWSKEDLEMTYTGPNYLDMKDDLISQNIGALVDIWK